jgi:hypothetical protein
MLKFSKLPNDLPLASKEKKHCETGEFGNESMEQDIESACNLGASSQKWWVG